MFGDVAADELRPVPEQAPASEPLDLESTPTVVSLPDVNNLPAAESPPTVEDTLTTESLSAVEDSSAPKTSLILEDSLLVESPLPMEIPLPAGSLPAEQSVLVVEGCRVAEASLSEETLRATESTLVTESLPIIEVSQVIEEAPPILETAQAVGDSMANEHLPVVLPVMEDPQVKECPAVPKSMPIVRCSATTSNPPVPRMPLAFGQSILSPPSIERTGEPIARWTGSPFNFEYGKPMPAHGLFYDPAMVVNRCVPITHFAPANGYAPPNGFVPPAPGRFFGNPPMAPQAPGPVWNPFVLTGNPSPIAPARIPPQYAPRRREKGPQPYHARVRLLRFFARWDP